MDKPLTPSATLAALRIARALAAAASVKLAALELVLDQLEEDAKQLAEDHEWETRVSGISPPFPRPLVTRLLGVSSPSSGSGPSAARHDAGGHHLRRAREPQTR